MSGVEVQNIPLVLIDTGVRLRGLNDLNVRRLIASMQDGNRRRLIQPITLRPKTKGGFWLVAGAHRLEAARQLGWKEIPALVDDTLTEDDALIKQIDENLIREELSPYDSSEFHMMRQRLSVKKTEKLKELPTLLEIEKAFDKPDYYEEMASLTGQNPETIRLAVRRRRQLDHVWTRLKGTDAEFNGALLDRLRKKFNARADEVIDLAKTFDNKIALAMNQLKAAETIKKISAKQLLKNLRTAWRACPTKERAIFLAEIDGGKEDI